MLARFIPRDKSLLILVKIIFMMLKLMIKRNKRTESLRSTTRTRTKMEKNCVMVETGTQIRRYEALKLVEADSLI